MTTPKQEHDMSNLVEALRELVARVEVEATYRGWGEWGAMTAARAALAEHDAAPQPAQWIGSIPAEESDEEFARQVQAMDAQPAAHTDQVDCQVRQVRCWYCGQQMHYAGHVAHEPEVRLTLDTVDTDENLYLHTRCWNEWQQRRR